MSSVPAGVNSITAEVCSSAPADCLIDSELAGYDYSPALRARVRLTEKGTVR